MSVVVNRPAWLAARRLVRSLVRPLLAARGFAVVGAERLPRRRKTLLIVCNHAALVDSVYLIAAIRPRFVICGARPAYFDSPTKRALMALANIAPIGDREEYLTRAMRLLCAGEIVLTYPEMARNPNGMGAFVSWAAEAALGVAAPVLPCYLYGTTRGQHRARLFVGTEIEPAGDAEALTERLRTTVAALVPRDLPGAGR
jgi:1-acyl-sn-glycerol-3-phosphate acyltransferase